MENITLKKMTRELCHDLYKNWQNDESIFMDMSLFKTYVYNETLVDKYFDSKQEPTRILFAIMLGERPIGELQLKQINLQKKECSLSIHMQNDLVKGKGYGTEAERQAVRFAFDEMGLNTVYADTVIKNTRSQHILEKIGFTFIKEEGDFKLYKIEK